MLYHSRERIKQVLKSVEDNPIICHCFTKMIPHLSPFSKDYPEWRFMRMICPNCGEFLKSDIEKIPNEWNYKQGFRRVNQRIKE